MKKFRFIAILIISTMLWGPIAVEASNIAIDSKSSGEGIVKVSYSGISNKAKVMVEKGTTKYYYDLKQSGDSFPLQLGDGSYTVAVLENTSGNSYKILKKKSFKADILEENSVYLKSIQPVLWNEDMEAIKLAASLTEGMEDENEIVQTIYDYVISNISYDYAKISKLSSDYTPDIDTILKDGKGICYDYSVLFAAMLRSQGIPTKLIKGYRDDLKAYHAWNEVYLNGSWKVIDTTYSACELRAKIKVVMFQNDNQYKKSKEF